MRRVIAVAVLAVVAFACSEQAGQMLIDAGEMMQPDAGAQDTPVECNKSEQNPNSQTKQVWHWAEFEIDPGRTEVTVCTLRPGWPFGGQTHCSRSKALWIQGTNTAIVFCGFEYEDRIDNEVTSITVHG